MPVDKTFRSFTPAQAAAYASNRGFSYPRALYDAIFTYMNVTPPSATNNSSSSAPSTRLGTLLDVGTGPGKVVYDMHSFFNRSVGIDPGVAMVDAARADARLGKAKEEQGKEVRFEVCAAEECGDSSKTGLEEGSVDLVTVAMAAHWFEMPAFYESAAKVLKPGGTLAMWTTSSLYAHPADPLHNEIQAMLRNLEDVVLLPYHGEGTKITKNRYLTLPLPWTTSPKNENFSEASFVRNDWDTNGIPSGPPAADGKDSERSAFQYGKEVTPAQVGAGIGSSSSCVRWRQAHKEALEKGEIEDVGEGLTRQLEELLKDRPGKSFVVAPSCSMLLMKRV